MSQSATQQPRTAKPRLYYQDAQRLPAEVQGEKYRNTHGVYLKLMNLPAVQTGRTHGMNRTSQADAAVWRDYIDNLDALHAEAAAIRQRLAEGVLTPASTAAPTAEDVPHRGSAHRTVHDHPVGEPREAERAEAALVHRYRDHLAAQGIAASRKRYRAGQVRPMFCDLWVQGLHALIEVKNSDGREALRMAIGRPARLPPLPRTTRPPRRPAPAPAQPGRTHPATKRGHRGDMAPRSRIRDSANGAFVEQTTDLPRPDLAQRETLGRLGRVSGRLKRSSQSDGS